MSRWWDIDSDALNDPTVQLLPPRVFGKKFFAALRGENNEFSRFIRIGRDRPSVPEWAKLRSDVFRRDNFTCQYCGDHGGRLECDHVMPISRGGSSDPSNLKTACFTCNRSKRAKTPEEWLR